MMRTSELQANAGNTSNPPAQPAAPDTRVHVVIHVLIALLTVFSAALFWFTLLGPIVANAR